MIFLWNSKDNVCTQWKQDPIQANTAWKFHIKTTSTIILKVCHLKIAGLISIEGILFMFS